MALISLLAESAADLMSRDPVSLDMNTSADEAARVLTSRGIGAAVVIDSAGRPIGVVTKTDLLIHAHCQGRNEMPTTINNVMTTAVFSVRTDTPAKSVIDQFLALNVHHLFVMDTAGTLVGVISPVDVLKRLG
jgi:CBS-domain-containing membrane protein